MLAGYVASLVLGVLGGYWFARMRGVNPMAPEPQVLRKEAQAPRVIIPTVEEEIARALGQGAPLTLFYLAWDAHDAQDPTLRLIESMLVRLVRPYDAIVPLGEGRFLLVLPQVGEAAADTVASRLIQELRLLASVHLTSSETLLPRISMAAPVGVKRLLEASIEASELAPPWRGDRGQMLRVGMVVLERPEVSLLTPLPSGTVLRLKDRGIDGHSSSRVQVVDPLTMRLKPVEPLFRLPGETVVLILEEGHTWMRGEVEILEASDGDLRVSHPKIVHRVPRRRVERFRMRLPVQLADLEGFTLNLSADGFRAVFPIRAFTPGQILDGGLALPDERHPVRIEVIKIRSAEASEGMIVGCRFVGLEPAAQKALAGLLSRQAEG